MSKAKRKKPTTKTLRCNRCGNKVTVPVKSKVERAWCSQYCVDRANEFRSVRIWAAYAVAKSKRSEKLSDPPGIVDP